MKILGIRFFCAVFCIVAANMTEALAIPQVSSVEINEELNKEIADLHQQMKSLQSSLKSLEEHQKKLAKNEITLSKYTAKHEHDTKLLMQKGHHTAGPELIFSGSLAFDILTSDRSYPASYTGTGSNNLQISNAQINAHATVSPWIQAYLSLNDGFGLSNATPAGDTLQFEQAYIQLGRRESPYLINVGKQYLPFGVYKQHPITAPLTQELSEFVKETAVFGYRNKQFFSSAYLFAGETSTHGPNHDTSEKLNHNYGFEIGASNKANPRFGYDTSLGYISNLTEARNIYTVVPITRYAVPAISPHVNLAFGKLNFILDYVHSIRTYNVNDISMNGRGARPRAFASEVYYHFLTNKNPSTFAIGYQKSWDSLFLRMPKHRYTASYIYHFNQYLSMQFELMHNVDYSSNDQATFLNGEGFTAGTGGSSNSGIMRVNMHF